MGTNTQSEETNAFTVNSPEKVVCLLLSCRSLLLKVRVRPLAWFLYSKRLLALPQHLLDPGLLEASRGFSNHHSSFSGRRIVYENVIGGCFEFVFVTPRPVVALPCASMSTSKTFLFGNKQKPSSMRWWFCPLHLFVSYGYIITRRTFFASY